MTHTPIRYGEPGYPLHELTPYRLKVFRAHGPGSHPCHWCGKSVRWDLKYPHPDSLVVDHIDEDRSNNALANLAISCQKCNAGRTVSRLHKEGHYRLPKLRVQLRREYRRLEAQGKVMSRFNDWLIALDTPDTLAIAEAMSAHREGRSDFEMTLQRDAWWASFERDQRRPSRLGGEASAVADPLDGGALQAD